MFAAPRMFTAESGFDATNPRSPGGRRLHSHWQKPTIFCGHKSLFWNSGLFLNRDTTM